MRAETRVTHLTQQLGAVSVWGTQSPHTCVYKEGEAANSSYLFPELGCNLGG